MPGRALRPLLWTLIGLAASAAFAQVETARITGVVTDPTGAVVAGARVTVIRTATNARQESASAADGRYLTLPLRIGEYRVEVEAAGFKRAVRSGVVLELQQTAVLDFQLALGATTESVDVTAEVPLLATSDASQGQVINNKRIVG